MVIEAAVVAAAALLLGVGVSAYRAFKTRHVTVARALARAKRVRVADFDEGRRAMIVGTVVAGERSVKAPLSGKPCAYFRVLVEGPETVGKEPETLLEWAEGGDFYVQDASGTARICVSEAQSSLAKESFDWHAAIRGKVDRRLPLERATDTALRKMSFYEGRLDEGETVAVAGRGRWKVAAQHGQGATYRQAARQLHITAPLYISDRSFDSNEDALSPQPK